MRTGAGDRGAAGRDGQKGRKELEDKGQECVYLCVSICVSRGRGLHVSVCVSVGGLSVFLYMCLHACLCVSLHICVCLHVCLCLHV